MSEADGRPVPLEARQRARRRGSLAGRTDKYGIVDAGGSKEQIAEISAIVEKPKPDKAPSNLAVVGRYVLTPAIFDYLQHIGTGAGGEIQLTDGIAALLGEEPVYAYRFQGKRYDCGNKLGYLQATVEFGLKHGKLGAPFRAYLQELMKSGV